MSDTTLLPHQESSLTFFLSLVSGRLRPCKLWYEREYRMKYLLRSLLYPVQTHRLINAITTEPVMRNILPVQHTLPSKIHRPYLYGGMPVMQRVRAVIDHYDFVKNLASFRLQQAMLTPQGMDVLTFSGKDGEHFTMTLACTGGCEREGEVNLFIHVSGKKLAMLTFAVTRQNGSNVIVIGGIQGAHRDTPHELIREATKACYGLFPKRLLMETLLLFCQATEVKQIQAVSDAGHIFRSLRYRLKKKDVFLASYNEYWETMNAKPLSASLYEIPLAFPRKPLEAIPSKKRSEYRRRYELLDGLSEQFSRQL